MTDAIVNAVAATVEPERRRRGRPKGQPKTGGRVAGTKNWTSQELRGTLLARSNAIEVLCDVVAGRELIVGPTHGPGKSVLRRPSMDQRLTALKLVLGKILPDLSASEVTGKDGAPIVPAATIDEASRREMAKAVLAVLIGGNMANQTIEGEATAGGVEMEAMRRSAPPPPLSWPLAAATEVTERPRTPNADRDAVEISKDHALWIAPADVLGNGTRRWEIIYAGVSMGFRNSRAAAEATALGWVAEQKIDRVRQADT